MKKSHKKPEVETVDITPTWTALMPILVNGAARGDRGATQELERALGLADAYVEAHRPEGHAKEVEAVRRNGVEGAKFLESTERGRKVMDAVQRLFSTYGAGGYGLDTPGMQALAAVVRAASRACFTDIVQKVPSEARVHEEYRLARGSVDTMKFRIRRSDNMHWLIEYESDSPEGCLFGSSINDAMRMPLHQAISRRAVLESHCVPVEIIAE